MQSSGRFAYRLSAAHFHVSPLMDNLPNDQPPSNSWVMFPFAEQLFTVALFVCLGPGAGAMWAIGHGKWIGGVTVLVFWGVVFIKFIRFLSSRKLVRLVISVPCTILVLAASLFVP